MSISDSIIGIRTSSVLKPSNGTIKKDTDNFNSSNDSSTATTIPFTSSVTTQTPKSQKRVTIVEEPKKTILLPSSLSSSPPSVILRSSSSLLPTSGGGGTGDGDVSCSGNIGSSSGHIIQHQSKVPIIMITSSSGENETSAIGCEAVNSSSNNSGMKQISGGGGGAGSSSSGSNDNTENTYGTDNSQEPIVNDPIDGMLDRITHDLDYLLNRTNEVPTRRMTAGSSENSRIISNNDNNNGCNDGEHNSTSNQSNNNDSNTAKNDSLHRSHLHMQSSDVAIVAHHPNSIHQIFIQSPENDTISLSSTSAPLPPPPPPSSSSTSLSSVIPLPSSSSLSSLSTHCRTVHEVIIEESEQE